MYSDQAGKSGFADEVVHKYILEKAGIDAVRRLSAEHNNHSSVRKKRRSNGKDLVEKLVEGNAAGRKFIFKQARKQAEKESGGNYPAPLKISESVECGFLHGFEKGLIREAELFGQLAVTPESRALVQLFFDVNRAKKNPLADEVRSVSRMAVIGAGRSEEHTSELQSRGHLVCRLLLEK